MQDLKFQFVIKSNSRSALGLFFRQTRKHGQRLGFMNISLQIFQLPGESLEKSTFWMEFLTILKGRNSEEK